MGERLLVAIGVERQQSQFLSGRDRRRGEVLCASEQHFGSIEVTTEPRDTTRHKQSSRREFVDRKCSLRCAPSSVERSLRQLALSESRPSLDLLLRHKRSL